MEDLVQRGCNKFLLASEILKNDTKSVTLRNCIEENTIIEYNFRLFMKVLHREFFQKPKTYIQCLMHIHVHQIFLRFVFCFVEV